MNQPFSPDSNSKIAETAKIYDGVKIHRSTVGEHSIVGDRAIITNSILRNNVSINRDNHVLKSDIGRYSYTAERTKILNSTVGSFCSIAWHVSIGAGKHDSSMLTTHPLWRFHMLDTGNLDHDRNDLLKKRYETMTICKVGSDVWIAPNVVIISDLTIGNGSIIGAGSIVTKNVEPYSIVVGSPARVIKKRFSDEVIELLEEIRWWDWPIEVIRKNLDLIYSTKIDGSVIERLREVASRI